MFLYYRNRFTIIYSLYSFYYNLPGKETFTGSQSLPILADNRSNRSGCKREKENEVSDRINPFGKRNKIKNNPFITLITYNHILWGLKFTAFVISESENFVLINGGLVGEFYLQRYFLMWDPNLSLSNEFYFHWLTFVTCCLKSGTKWNLSTCI